MGAKKIGKNDFKQKLQTLSFPDSTTRWLNDDAMTLITSFGKPAFPNATDSVEVNKIHNPVTLQVLSEW